jgi:hypothetical protein
MIWPVWIYNNLSHGEFKHSEYLSRLASLRNALLTDAQTRCCGCVNFHTLVYNLYVQCKDYIDVNLHTSMNHRKEYEF